MSDDVKLNLVDILQDYHTLMQVIDKLSINVEDAKQPISELKHDIVKSYCMIANTLSPFYSISDQSIFAQSFKTSYSNFKKKYTDSTGDIDPYKLNEFHISCTMLENELRTIYDSTKDKELKKIIDSEKLWFQNDFLSHKRVYNFLNKLNNGLKNVKSYDELKELLSDKQYFDELKSILGTNCDEYPKQEKEFSTN